jgi:hypothetical protein
VNENIKKNGSVSNIKCKDCSIVKDKKNQDLLVYNDREVDGVFTDMKAIFVEMFHPYE